MNEEPNTASTAYISLDEDYLPIEGKEITRQEWNKYVYGDIRVMDNTVNVSAV